MARERRVEAVWTVWRKERGEMISLCYNFKKIEKYYNFLI